MTYPGTLLRAWKLLAKKELGQNFLTDPKTAEMIVNRAGISADDVVLEIGSGLGALTIPGAKKAKKLFAVEKDTRLISLLRAELAMAEITNVTLMNSDIFKVDMNTIAREGKLFVLGNLPYNISSQVLFKLVENRVFVKKAVLMFQKELAQRIGAAPGGRDYGRLSAVIQYCADVKTVTDVGANLFFPKPIVESRVIEVSFSKTTPFSGQNEKLHFKIIKAAFSKRRKTLRNAMAGNELGLSKTQTFELISAAGIDPSRRAETLNTDDFTALTTAYLNKDMQT